MCLETLVTLADEPTGDWAYIGNVLRLIEDRSYRDAMVKALRDRGATDLVTRWGLPDGLRDGERAEVEQWFISKFGDFRRPGGLAKATFGKPDVCVSEKPLGSRCSAGQGSRYGARPGG